MPLSEIEKKERRRISDKKYYEKNIEKIKLSCKLYQQINKEILKERHKIYRKNNKDKEKVRHKKYNQSPQGIKTKVKLNWKNSGIIDLDIDSVYEYFITQTECWICYKEFNKDIVMDRRCLDHDHTLENEPNIRYICCTYCNLHIIK